MNRRRFCKWLGIGPLLATVGWRGASHDAKTRHIPEDWSRWLMPPNFRRNNPSDPNIAIDFRFKAVGPGSHREPWVAYRNALRITETMTVQEAADAFIGYGKSLHRFVRAYEGGKRRTIASAHDFVENDDLEPLPYHNQEML